MVTTNYEFTQYVIRVGITAGWGPPSLLSNGYRRAYLQGLKRPGCEADHSHLFSTEISNDEVISPLPHMSSWYNAYVIKHREIFVFTFFTFTHFLIFSVLLSGTNTLSFFSK
jgi:hypothetical protein